MFDDAKTQLVETLDDRNEAIPVSDAEAAIPGGALVAEQILDTYAEIETHDGTEYVVAVDDTEYPLPSTNGQADSVDHAAEVTDDHRAEAEGEPVDAEAAQADAEADDSEDDASPTPTAEDAQQAAQPVQTTRGGPVEGEDYWEVNGLRITEDPEKLLVGEPTGETDHGMAVLENDNPLIPNVPTSYLPVEIDGNRTTLETTKRLLGQGKNVLLEGEAGTGKNTLARTAANDTHRITQRMNFGGDTSVYDLMGERDVLAGSTVFILGKLAKAGMFGHTFIADEINMVRGDIGSYIHAAAERVGEREIDIRGTDVTLRDLPEGEEWDAAEHLGEYIHPEFRIVGTCNPLDYADTKPMNDALRSRFTVVEVPYLDPEAEASLLADETGIDAERARTLVEIAETLREAKRADNAIQCPITHRELVNTIELAGPDESFMPLIDAARIVLVGRAQTKSDKTYIGDTLDDEAGAF